MFKMSTKKGNVIIEMDDTTCCAVVQTLWMAIGDCIPNGFSPEKQEAMAEVERVLYAVFYSEEARHDAEI